MLSDEIIKIILSVIVFAIAYYCGILPVNGKIKNRKFLCYGESFARGVFLGAGLIHLLPDAMTSFAQAEPQMDYPLIAMLVAATVFLLQFVEQGVIKLVYRGKRLVNWRAYLLLVMLAIHSLIAGAALGVSGALATTLAIFIAIMAHKGAAAFALGINMQKSQLAAKHSRRLMFVFSLMTPLGIWLGMYGLAFAHGNGAHLSQAIFDAIAAGTFIYIATFNHVHLHDHDCQDFQLAEITALGIGLGLMALLALFL